MRILYVEDRDNLSNGQSPGERSECELEVAAGAREAIARIEECRYDPFDLAVAAVSVPDDECVEVIRYVREHHLSLPVMVNANDISKLREAETSLRSAMAELEQLKNQLQQENVYLQQEIKLEHFPGNIIGESAALRDVLRKVEQVSTTDATVLILGETGTGKELIARAIHSASRRKDRPLVKVDCAALLPALIESELFGHEKGAFTGAQARKIGRFELANGATLLLDEIGELPLDLQAKLLRVLQEGEFERLGSSNTIKLNVRVIAATNRDLKQDVQEGRFRADLWYRLNIFPITMPPLRKRRQDLRLLVKHFAAKFSQKAGKRFAAISPAAVKAIEE